MAEELYVESKLDATQLYADLKKLKAEIDKMNISVKVKTPGIDTINNSAKTAKQSIDSLSKSQENLNVKSAQTNKQINDTATSLKNAGVSADSFGPGYKAAANKVVELTTELKNLKLGLKNAASGDVNKFEAAILTTKNALGKARSEMRSFTSEVGGGTSILAKFRNSVETGLLSTIGVFSIVGLIGRGISGMVSSMKESIQTAISFESAFAGVRKTVEASEYDFRSFNDEIKSLTKEIPKTYEELAKIAELGGQMGVPIEQLSSFVKTLAALEVSTNLGLEDAALQFGRIANVLGISFDEVDRLGSAVVGLGNNFAATESEITSFLQRISGTGGVVGVSAGALAGIAAATTSVGIQAEKGGTAINKMFMAIEGAVNDGGAALNKFAKLTGKTAGEFASERKTSAGDVFVDVVEGLGKAGSGATKYLDDLVGGGVRLQETFLNLASASDVLRAAVAEGNTQFNANTALWEEAAKRYGTTESKLKMLDNEIRLQEELIGKNLLPTWIALKTAIVDVYSGVANAIQWFNNLTSSARTLLEVMGGGGLLAILYAINPIFAAVGALIGGASTLFKALSTNVESTSVYMQSLNDTLGKTNKELANTDKSISELNAEFAAGGMAQQSYIDRLKELIKKKLELEGIQKNIAKEQAGDAEITDYIARSQENLVSKQKEYSLAVLKSNNALKELNELRDKKSSGTLTEKEVARYEELDKQFFNLKLSEKGAEDALTAYGALVGKTNPSLLLLQKYAGDTYDVMGLINEINLSTDANQSELDALRLKYGALGEAAIQSAKDQLAAAIAVQNIAVSKVQNIPNTYLGQAVARARGFYKQADAASNNVIALTKDLGKLGEMTKKGAFDELSKGMGAIRDIDVKDALSLDINAFTASENQLQAGISRLTFAMSKLNKESDAYNELAGQKAELSKRLAKLQSDETDALEDYVKKGGDASKVKEAQIKLLELEAMRRIALAKENINNEESVAQEILNINQRLSDEKSKLDKDYVGLAVDGANEIIDKYKEIKKVGEDAFKSLVDDVKDTASEIGDLTKKVEDTNDGLYKLFKEKNTDLGNRYTEISKSLEDLDKQISDINGQLLEQSEDGKTVAEVRDKLQTSIDDTTKSAEDFQKEIDKINESIDELNKGETESLSARYAESTEELIKLNKELEIYTRYGVLTDADATKKAELESQVNDILSEQSKIRGELTSEQLTAAQARVGETETDKIIREAEEKRLAYQVDISNYETKLQTQNSLLETYKQEEVIMQEKYGALVADKDEKTYQELLDNLKEYTAQKKALLDEQSSIESLLTEEQIQDAINQSKKTETQLILDKYNESKALLDTELADYKSQLNEKLVALAAYYGDAAKLSQKYSSLGLNFTEEQIAELVASGKNLVGNTKSTTLVTGIDTQKDLLKEQVAAKKQLELISTNIAKLTDSQLKGFGESNLLEIYKKIAELKLTASGTSVGTSTTTNSITNNQSFNLASNLDAAAIARKIRLSIKI